MFPEAKHQRRAVHFYCDVFSVVPRSKTKLVVSNVFSEINKLPLGSDRVNGNLKQQWLTP